MRTYFSIYHHRKGNETIKFIQENFCRKEEVRPTKSFGALSNDTFTEITKFLDIASIATLEGACKTTSKKVAFQPVWKFHYEESWRKLLVNSGPKEVMLNHNYKSLCVESYLNYKRDNE